MSGRVASPTLHATVLFLVFSFVVLIAVSFILRIEIVAQGSGKIVPSQRIQVVQSEYPAQITAIHVGNGDTVSRGEVLIELDVTDSLSRLNATKIEKHHLGIERQRIDLLINEVLDKANTIGNHQSINLGQDLARDFASPKHSSQSGFFSDQAQLLEAELREIYSRISELAIRMEANILSEAVTLADIDRVNASLEIQGERLSALQTLSSQGTASRSNYLDVLEVFTSLEKQRTVYERELEQKRIAQSALMAERTSYLAGLRRGYLQRIAQIEERLAEINELLIAYERRLSKLTLRAPVDGVVDQLAVHTIGGLADKGAPLLHIVPTGSNLEVEAVFANVDVGFLQAGQDANIRLDAFPSERFGFVPGSVTNVAADSVEVETNFWGYMVRVQPDMPFLDAPLARHDLKPGMTARIDIVTGDRALISYFFAPIVKTIQASLGER